LACPCQLKLNLPRISRIPFHLFHRADTDCLLCAVQVVQGKMAFMSSLAGMHPLGKAMADPEAALAGLMGKVGQFKAMLSNPGQGHFKDMMTTSG
jgi:hypothetical protein